MKRIISLIKNVEAPELCIRHDVAKRAFFRASDCTGVSFRELIKLRSQVRW